MRFKGFVLSAGFGTRLRPVTYKVPKPLVELGNKPLIAFGIDLLKKAGINEIGINAHYKGEFLKKYAEENHLAFFYERNILGTGGYLLNLGDFFNTPLVTVNCDTVFFEDRGIVERLKKYFLSNPFLAVLVLAKRNNKALTPIEASNGKVVKIGGEGDYFFTGLQILSPEILPYVKTSIVETYNILISKGLLGFVEFGGVWFDCGTLEGLIDANLYLNGAEKSFVYQRAEISGEIVLEGSVIYPGAKVWGEGMLRNCIVYRNASLHLKKERIENRIIV